MELRSGLGGGGGRGAQSDDLVVVREKGRFEGDGVGICCPGEGGGREADYSEADHHDEGWILNFEVVECGLIERDKMRLIQNEITGVTLRETSPFYVFHRLYSGYSKGCCSETPRRISRKGFRCGAHGSMIDHRDNSCSVPNVYNL